MDEAGHSEEEDRVPVWEVGTLCNRCNELGMYWPQNEAEAGERRLKAQHKIKHVRQRLAWDCGIACVLMVTNQSWQEAHAVCGTSSVWTVDLAYLLTEFRIHILFLTKTLGCDPSYRDLSFYQRDIGGDQQRIQDLFKKRQKWISRASVPTESLLALLRAGFVIIALVDLRFLKPSDELLPPSYTHESVSSSNDHTEKMNNGDNLHNLLDDRKTIHSTERIPPADLRPNSYTGHYVLLVGVLSRGTAILYKDPASAVPCHAIQLADLDAARTAHGTDEDLIIVDLVNDY